jgi:hypothetical protein
MSCRFSNCNVSCTGGRCSVNKNKAHSNVFSANGALVPNVVISKRAKQVPSVNYNEIGLNLTMYRDSADKKEKGIGVGKSLDNYEYNSDYNRDFTI